MIRLSDQEIFAGVYTKYFPRLVVFARPFTDSIASAEDIVQDVFLKLHKVEGGFGSEAQLSSFLYKSVRNSAIDHLRSQKRKAGMEFYREERYTEDDAVNDELDGDLLYLLTQSLDDLPPQSRKVIGLLFENDLSYKDVAAALDISPNTVKNIRKFALDLLRKKLGHNKLMTYLLFSFRLIPGM